MRYHLRTLLIVLALGPPVVAGMAYQLFRYWRVVEAGRGHRLPPTMYGEPLALAVVIGSLGLIAILIASKYSQSPPSA